MAKRIEVKMAETDPGRLEDEANKQIDNNGDLKKDEKEDLRAYTKSVQALVDSLGELDSFEGCICIVKTKAGCIQTAMFAPEYKFEEDWWLMRMAEMVKEARGRHSFDKTGILKNKEAQKMLKSMWRKAPKEIREKMTYKGFCEGVIDVCIDKLLDKAHKD